MEKSSSEAGDTDKAFQTMQPLSKNLSGKDFDGNDIDSSLFSKNAVTVMNFWFTGCKPCVAELSKLDELNNAIKAMGGEVIRYQHRDPSIIIRMPLKRQKKYWKARAQNTVIFPLTDSDVGQYAANIMAFPTTILVDRNGNIIGDPLLGGIDSAG